MSSVSYAYLDELMTKDDEAFFKRLGKRIAERRKELGLTQVQLAEILGVSQQHMVLALKTIDHLEAVMLV